MIKKCFEGTSLDEFFETQYGNLNAVVTDISLNNQYMTATHKFEIVAEDFDSNAFLFFINNVDNQNRQLDVCWNDCDLDQETYFTLVNTTPSFSIKTLIMGNTAGEAIESKNIIVNVRERDSFNLEESVFKNFDCSLLGNYFFEFDANTDFFGKCHQSCQDGFFKDKGISRCSKCTPNCKTCSNFLTCLSCQKGEILINGKCEKCNSQCLDCSGNQSSCTSCKNNPELFNPVTNSCDKLCADKTDSCGTCDHKTGNCISCKLGYSLVENQCILTSCNVLNCRTCETANSCLRCDIGYD